MRQPPKTVRNAALAVVPLAFAFDVIGIQVKRKAYLAQGESCFLGALPGRAALETTARRFYEPGLGASFAAAVAFVLIAGFATTVFRESGLSKAGKTLAVALPAGLVLIGLYALWDPRDHGVWLAPVAENGWQDHPPDLPLETFCGPVAGGWPYSWVRYVYPIIAAPRPAFYGDGELTIGIFPADLTRGLNPQNIAPETLDASRSGAAFIGVFNHQAPDIEPRFSRLKVLEPCGPGVDRSVDSRPQLRFVPFENVGLVGSIHDPRHTHIATLLVLQGERRRMEECTLRMRDITQTPSGRPIPDLRFRAVRSAYVRGPGGIF